MSATVAVVRSQVSDYVELTKPRIALLVLVTTFTGMWMAAGGPPSLPLVVSTLLGTWMGAASAAVLNNYVDREVDALMSRTCSRALPAGRVSPYQALGLGILLACLAFFWLFFTVNLLTATLVLSVVVFYVGVYTVWLKRASAWCTEIGGVAGALPPVVGWAAVTNDIGTPALVLFLIMFLWQPPHFWALAVLRAEEYRRAGLPMLPVVRGTSVTQYRMLLYTAALVPATLSMYAMQWTGPVYLAAAVGLGGLYLALTIDFIAKPLTAVNARKLFAYSILYLLVLFTLMFIDFRRGGGML